MKLQIFNAENSLHIRKKETKAMVGISFKTGLITLNPPAVNALNLKKGDLIAMAYDEDSNDWLLFKDAKGFDLRFANGKKDTTSLVFNCSKIANSIMEQLENPSIRSGKMQLAIEPVQVDGINYYTVIFSSFKASNK